MANDNTPKREMPSAFLAMKPMAKPEEDGCAEAPRGNSYYETQARVREFEAKLGQLARKFR